jgi:periplasmic protein TonB
MTNETQAMDEFDVLLNDVLRTVANPELPERTRVHVQTRVWVREMKNLNPTVAFAPEVFLDFERRMHPRRDAKSTTTAMLLHAAAIALLFWGVSSHIHSVNLQKQLELTKLEAPPPMAPLKDTMGGGGGQRGPTPVSKGQLPKFAETQITPPKAPPMEQPKIRMPDPTIEVQTNLKMANNNMPNLGMPNSPMIGTGPLGNGTGTGIGSGNGAGLGPGSGGNYGGGLRKIGGGVSSPVVISKVEPEFSEEARKAKFMGVVLVNLIVDAKGMPQNVHVLRGVGMGLDDKALAAVRQYRFKPAIEGGKPVPVELNVEVDFQIF